MYEYHLPHNSFDLVEETTLVHLIQPNYPMNYYLVLPVMVTPIFAHLTYQRVANIIINVFEKSRLFIAKVIEYTKNN